MTLEIRDGNNVYGSYYYHSQKRYISIIGEATRNGLTVKEYSDNDEITGEFVGVFDSAKMTFNGNWINAKTKKSMPFSLSKDTKAAVNRIEVFERHYSCGDVFTYNNTYLKIYSDNNARIINALNRMFESNADTFELYVLDEYSYFFDPNSGAETDSTSDCNYVLSRYSDFIYVDENIISIGVFLQEHDYSGNNGSMGKWGHNSYNIYNAKTGRLLNDDTIYNLVDYYNVRSFIALIRAKLEPEYDYALANCDDEDIISISSNFCIDIDGVHFTLYLYEYPIEVSFTFEELKPFVSDGSDYDSPFYYLFE